MGNPHKKILEGLCMALNNCADCGRDIGCCPSHILAANSGLHIQDGDSFTTDVYSAGTNRELRDIARQHGYAMAVTSTPADACTLFVKRG